MPQRYIAELVRKDLQPRRLHHATQEERMQNRLLLTTLGLTAVLTASALAQTGQPPASPPPSSERRPATTTPSGDTGLWFVPTGEILPARAWSFSAYRVNFDYEPGFTDVSNWPVTFGVGAGDRVELFGALSVVNRIDRDARPLFFQGPGGGVVNAYPFVRDGWSGNQLGDLWLGGKVNITSQHRQAPAAFALRGLVKLPTAGDEDGSGTGKLDFAVDGVVSKEINGRVELAGFGGFVMRGDPDAFDLLNGFRWGLGAGMPARRNLRLTAELHGEIYSGDAATFNGVTIQTIDGSVLPASSAQNGPLNASLGLTWQGRNGLFAGGGINWNMRLDGRSDFGSFENEGGDAIGLQLRVGYHPGVRAYVAPAPPAPQPPPPAAAPNRPPGVRARCEPCTVEIGKTSTVSADATDPDGDPLTYAWSAAAGQLTSASDRQSPWTAPMQEGPVPVTVTVNDGRGGSATDAVTIQVVRPVVKEFTFEDVHFDFDRYSLRPEAVRALDEAVRTLQENAALRLEVEGHTCNIGTAEYNLALGERRAHAVRDYLASRGIGADRLRTVSYGEERPKHDNAREETRRLNRRAAMVVRIVQ
jgi:outer membrane protein OmpA-like peptidoglycan-associated protein